MTNSDLKIRLYIYMGERSDFPKSWTFEIQILKLIVSLQIISNFKLNGQLPWYQRPR